VHKFNVDGEGHNGQTRAKVHSCQHHNKHSRCQLIAVTTEHGKHDDVAGDSENAEDDEQTDHNIQFDGAWSHVGV